MADEPLGDGAARVVRDDRDVVEAEGLDEVRHDPGHSRNGQVGVIAQRDRVRSVRKVRNDAATLARQLRRDAPPKVAVDPHSGTNTTGCPLPLSRYSIVPAGMSAARRSPSSGLTDMMARVLLEFY
jgi:hypothetical protein